MGCVGGGWPSQGAGAMSAGLLARLPQPAGPPPPGDLLAVRQAQALIAAMPRGLPLPQGHPPGVLTHVRSSSPVGGKPVGGDHEPAGAPLEGIAGGKGAPRRWQGPHSVSAFQPPLPLPQKTHQSPNTRHTSHTRPTGTVTVSVCLSRLSLVCFLESSIWKVPSGEFHQK